MHARLLILTLMNVLLLGAAQAGEPANKKDVSTDGTTITLNFVDTDIREVAGSVSEITGKNFIIDPRVKGRVTLVSARPISINAVYDTFLSVLQVHQFSAISTGDGLIKIIPAVDARQIAGGAQQYQNAPFDDMVTQVIEVRNVSAAQLVPVLRPLIPQYGHITAYPGSNVLIMSDRAGNIARLVDIIRRVDQSSDDEIEIIPLQNASASETVRVLSALMQSANRDPATPAPTLVADDRTNSILIGGDSASRLRLRTLVTHLDTPLEAGGNTQVIYLSYANAENLATILKGHVSETASQQGGDKAAANSDGYSNVIILHEPDTNALVVTAPQKVMRNLQNIIEKLDIRRAQVHVEAIIAEVTADNTAELGVTWAVADESGENGPAGLTNFPGSGIGVGQVGAAIDGDSTAGAALLQQAAGLTLGFGRIVDGDVSFVGLLRALAGNSSTNILSTPSLTMMDNEEAEIKVGQEVPFLSGSFTNTGGTGGAVNPFQTIQRQEVGISLTVTPQISDSDTIVLKIAQEVSSLSQGSQGAVDLITNKRTINTSVIAENGEIIVLGGLIDDQVREGEQRVPLLGSIPLLGELFRYRTSSKVKRNLMAFIKPSILRTPVESAYFTNEKYNYMRDLQRGPDTDGSVQLQPGATQPSLSELPAVKETATKETATESDSPAESTTEPATERVEQQ